MEANDYVTWKRWDQKPFGAPDAWYRAFFRKELARTGRPSFERALELGFGNGEFLAFARARGIEATGVDTNERLVARARDEGFAAFTSTDQIPRDEKFDLVIAFDVLEHIDQDLIPTVLADLRERMQPGGALVARFPNGDSPFGRVAQNGDVTHRTAIGSQKLRYFAQTTGFDVHFCGPTSLPVRRAPPLKAAYALAVLPIRSAIDRFLALVYLQRTDITFSANLTAVLRKPA